MGGIGLENQSETRGICPLSKNLTRNPTPSSNPSRDPIRLTWAQLQVIFPDADPMLCLLELLDRQKKGTKVEDDPRLRLVESRWPQLPEFIRQTILTLACTAQPNVPDALKTLEAD